MNDRDDELQGIAIIGMAGRFPGAEDLSAYWRNLVTGVESISRFTAEELLAAGVEPARLSVPNFVPAAGAIEEIDRFDAPLFSLTAREASIMDPQYRFFLETAWAALEDSGYNPEGFPGAIGIFAGMSFSRYLVHNLLPNRELLRSVGELQLRIYNDRDFLASLAAYKLDLRGPSLSVQTACSTSLVATVLACQSLFTFQSDLALAGGVSLNVPAKFGYQAQEGVFSPAGSCRAFDAQAQGTVQGSGVGLVVLKRLAEAIADGDTVRAVIRGFATNNDGSAKVGYTAPSVDGQAEVIALAQAVAGIEPESVSYIETHGTGTPMGDPIEIAALTRAFATGTERRGFCAVGSVKPNIGHLDAAAGVASLIKATLALEHEQLPPSLGYERPNPAIDFASTPFFVNHQLRPWPRGEKPRRSGVSAFAVGGVNAHLVIEEAPPRPPSMPPARRAQALVMSGASETALARHVANLATWLEQHPAAELADVAFTLQLGRRALKHRRLLVAETTAEAAAALAGGRPLAAAHEESRERPIAFLFPGVGNHYPGMAASLYAHEPVFRAHADRCLEVLAPLVGPELAELLFSPASPAARETTPGFDFKRLVRGEETSAGALAPTRLAHPALFVVEYSLARQLEAWGVEPQAVAGYSIGQYAAACLAGVFELEDALTLIARRAALVDRLPRGAMTAVSAAGERVRPLLPAEVEIAATAGPEVVVVAGPTAAVAELEVRLAEAGITHRRLAASHAFHNPMMAPASAALAELVAGFKLKPPRLPLVSDLSGTWLTNEEATDPAYWASHLVRPVRFDRVIETLWLEQDRVFVEVGPGQTLGSWVLQHPASARSSTVFTVPTLPHAYEREDDQATLLSALGRVWLTGTPVRWQALHQGESRRRLPLPTYPFERHRYWIDPPPSSADGETPLEDTRLEAAQWFYLPLWRQLPPLAASAPSGAERWLLLPDQDGLGETVAAALSAAGHTVTLLPRVGLASAETEGRFRLDGEELSLAAALAALVHRDQTPRYIVDFEAAARPGSLDDELGGGFFTVLELATALDRAGLSKVDLELVFVTRGSVAVDEDDELTPPRAALTGALSSLAQELPRLSCRLVDLDATPRRPETEVSLLLAELASGAETLLAHRRGRRWRRELRRQRLEAAPAVRLAPDEVCLITGGLGGLGLSFADCLARRCQPRLVLAGRQGLPSKAEWREKLENEPSSEEARRIRAVLALEELGAQVLVASADVTRREDLEALRDQISATFGAPVKWLLHAAGVEPGGLLQVKDRKVAVAVLAPKVHGTLLLLETFPDAERVVLCSSLTALTGAFGLADHAAANAVLDQLAAACRHSRVISINWDTWLEVGQAARAAAALGARLKAPEAAGEPVAHPLFDHRLRDGMGFLSQLSTHRHWPLEEHRLAERAVLPGTALLEMARAAWELSHNSGATVLEEVGFLRPVVVPDGATATVTTRLTPSPHGGLRFVIEDSHGAVAASGRARAAEPGELPENLDLAALRQALEKTSPPPADESLPVVFGPRWQGLVKEIWQGDDEVLARLELDPRFAADCEQFDLHPALLDAATGLALWFHREPHLPLAYRRVVVASPLPSRLVSYVRRHPDAASPGLLSVDVRLSDEAGRVLVAIDGYQLRRVEDGNSLAPPPATADGLESIYGQGLSPTEGADALLRILASDLPTRQWVVSTRDFAIVEQRAEQLARSGASAELEALRAGRLARPAFASEYVAPRTALEQTLAALWSELLRVERVGVHDSFFDLGGDSLVATQLISRVAESQAVELPLQALFAAPTLAQFAETVLLRQAEAVDPEELAAVLAEIEEMSPEPLIPEDLSPALGEVGGQR